MSVLQSISFRKISTYAFLYFAIILKINGQIHQLKSIEFEYNSGVDRPEYSVIPLKNGGFILQEKIDAVYGRKITNWKTQKYNNALELVWSVEIPIEYDMSLNLNNDCLTNEHLYQNFSMPNSSEVKILKIDLEKGDFEWIEGDLIGIQDITQMKIIGNTAFFSGRFQGRAVVMGLSFFDKTVKALNGLYSNHMEVIEIEANEKRDQLLVYSRNRYKRLCQLQLRVYSEDGQPLSNTNLESEPKKMPFNGRLNHISDNESLMIGNYARFCDNFSQGIYVKKIVDNNVSKTKFIDFSDLNNFFNYLNPRRQKKVKERLSRRKLEGKAVNFNYSMLSHKLYRFNNQLVMVAEIYYTEAKNLSNVPFYLNGRDVTPYNYKFTHTIICGFDKEGNMLWDNCLPMKALSSNYLHEQVQISQIGEKLILAYPEDGKIKTTVIEGEKTIREKEVFEGLSTKSSFWDKDDVGGLSAWYDQNFLFWGFKTLPSSTNINGHKVFFINKLSYVLE